MRKNKRGILGFIFAIVILFALAVVILIGAKLASEFSDALGGSDLMGDRGKNVMTGILDKYNTLFDYAFLAMLVLFWAATIISVFFLDTHPIMFAISLLMLLFVFICAAVFSNVFYEVAMSSSLRGEAAQFPILMSIMNNYLVIAIFMGFSMLGAMYAKSKFGGGA